jgi:ubiquinone/menaquinone biosynthesis C-methylase UbiE
VKEATADKLLKEVRKTYNTISGEFSDTRNYSWPDFNFFKPYLFENAEIVDLGCGNGRLVRFLDQYFLGSPYRYIGIDNSEKLLEKAHQQFPKNVFLPGDQLDIPMTDHQVDLMFNIAAFHHIPSAKLRLEALQEMKRVIKPNGILIMTVWNLWQWKYRISILKAACKYISSLGKYAPNDLLIPWKSSHGDTVAKRYYHNFLPHEISGLLKQSGFKILKSFSTQKGVKTSFLKGFNYVIIAQNVK